MSDDVRADGSDSPRDADGSDAIDEAEKRRLRRAADAERKRKRRRDARALQNVAQARTLGTAPDVRADVAPSVALGLNVSRLARWLDVLEQDETCSTIEKVRAVTNALPALARAVDSSEFRQRLEDLERRVALHDRGRLRSA